MKSKERNILNKLNDFLSELYAHNFVEDNHKYSRYDAENEHYILEIKYRDTFYNDLLIEFDKYSYNLLYANMVKKQFIYAVQIEDRIYYFSGPTNGIYTSDISTLISEWGGDSVDDNFSWVSKDMTMDADNVDKRFVKLKIQANRELNTTPTVYIDDVAVTLTSVATNEWRINQKGKKIKVKLSSSSSTVTPSNETTTIFSMGIIYRSTKVK